MHYAQRAKCGEVKMYNSKSMIAEEFIDNEEILSTLEYAKNNKSNRELIESVLKKAEECKGLDYKEAILLLESDLEDINEKI